MGILLHLCLILLALMVISLYTKLAKFVFSSLKEDMERERHLKATVERWHQELQERIDFTYGAGKPRNSYGYGGWLASFTDDEIDRLKRGVPYKQILDDRRIIKEIPMTEIYY